MSANQEAAGLQEKCLPAWVVQDAVGNALDEHVVGIESNGDHTYSVLIEERDSDE